jgi:hypothetical protein
MLQSNIEELKQKNVVKSFNQNDIYRFLMIYKSFYFHNLQCHNYTYVYILLNLNRFGLKST